MKKTSVALGILAILIALSPYIASIPPFKQAIVWMAEQKTGARIQVEHLHLSWLGPQKMEGVHIATNELDARVQELISDVPLWKIRSMGQFITKINISGITRSDGKFFIKGSPTNAQFSMSQMPTRAIDAFFNTQDLAVKSLGKSFDASGSVSSSGGSGELDLELSATQGNARVHIAFSPDTVTLKKPLTVSLMLTPELTGSFYSIDPASLRIEPNGFLLQRPFSLATLRVKNGVLDLGRIHIQNGAFLLPLTTVLKAKISTQELDMWLTVADFSIDEVLTLGRVDALLASSLHVALWGTANLATEQLQMTFGLPADTLSDYLGIQNLPKDYVLQIPVTGTFHSPQFDTSNAKSQLTTLIATGQLQKQGGLLGLVGGIASKAAADKAPPPKTPFPWEK